MKTKSCRHISHRVFLIFAFTILSQTFLFSQKIKEPVIPFTKLSMKAGIGSVPLDEFVVPGSGDTALFNENSIHASAAVNLGRYIYFGLHYNYVWTRFDRNTVDEHAIYGIFGRFDYPLSKRFHINGDVSVNLGNYCPCNPDVRVDNFPYHKEDLSYLGLHFGGSYKVAEPFWVFISIATYDLLISNELPHYGYFQPLIGVEMKL